MLHKLKQAAYSFFLSKIILLAAIGRAFANDSPNSDVKPWWNTWLPMIQENFWGLVFGGLGILYLCVILFFLRVGYLHRNEPDQPVE